MKINEAGATGVKIAYIGGGSRGWAWNFMNDLAANKYLSGEVALYDVDRAAAERNAVIGEKYNGAPGALSRWDYTVAETLREALHGADFAVISILPGTFDEMESDVHAPEKYGIYQSVGDTAGPGGIVRAMRTAPMFEEIALAVKECCPDAWVINYTNPMTLCVKTLYRVFPGIKAFGCCHEVFGTQKLLARVAEENFGVCPDRREIKVNPVGVNHFTWLTDARWRGEDLFPLYRGFCEKYRDGYPEAGSAESNWMNNSFCSEEKVKIDLFRRFGYIAAAGDRHLAEFCPGKWYLAGPERVAEMKFALTSVAWRKRDLAERLARSERLASGEEPVKITDTGEEGVSQMAALLGFGDLVTNVNLPNRGQIPNLPVGAVVETNAVLRAGSVTPVFAGDVPERILPLVGRVSALQQALDGAIGRRSIKDIFAVFTADPLVTCSYSDARELFREMCRNTGEYLSSYDLGELEAL